MRLFWNRNAKNLSQIFDESYLDSDTAFLRQTSDIFAGEILEEIRKLHFSQFNDHNNLLKETLIELTSLLISQRENWKTLTVSDISILIQALLKATQWKLAILNYHYTIEKTTELAEHGLQVLPAVGETLEEFGNSNPDYKISSLSRKYLESPADYHEVTFRTLRCIIALLKNPVYMKQTIFAWNGQYQLKLKSQLMQIYLYDQLKLFAFMAKKDNDALPIRELRTKLQRFVQPRMSQQEKAKQALDMVHDALLHFFEKRVNYIAKSFYVDKKLESYVLDLAKNRKEIRKYRWKESIIQNENSLDEHQRPVEDEDLAEIIAILNSCLQAQDEPCKKMIRMRYLGDYADILSYQAIAEHLGENAKTIEKRGRSCNEKLKNCVTLKSKQRGLRPY